MRRRIGSALALWALVGLGHAGCATQSKRAEAPLQFRQWKDPSGATATSSAKAPAAAPATSPAQPPDLISSLLGRPAASAASASAAGSSSKDRAVASDIPANAGRPHYRPGSWLFRRFNKPAPPPTSAPPGDPSGSLARFFPTLYGKTPADPARLARAGRPQGDGPGLGRSLGLSGASIEMTQNTMAAPTDEPPLLADGLPVRAYPRAPSPSLPPSDALAGRDEPARGREATAPDEHLTSHEEPESLDSLAPRKRDLIDALSTHLESAPPRREPRPDPDDAPSDPAGRATSATVEVPTPRPVASAEAAPTGIAPLLNVALGSSPTLAPTTARMVIAARPSEAPAPPEPKRPEFRPAAFPALDGPRLSRALSAELPEPEFPATYHTESLRQVAREAPRPVATRPLAIEPAPSTPLLPRLSRLLWGPAPAEAK